jgi:hypothetical protein
MLTWQEKSNLLPPSVRSNAFAAPWDPVVLLSLGSGGTGPWGEFGVYSLSFNLDLNWCRHAIKIRVSSGMDSARRMFSLHLEKISTFVVESFAVDALTVCAFEMSLESCKFSNRNRWPQPFVHSNDACHQFWTWWVTSYIARQSSTQQNFDDSVLFWSNNSTFYS